MVRLNSRLGAIALTMVAWLAASPVRAVTVTDTTVAQFNAGTPGACYVAETTDGEVLLPPTEGAEFFGSALPVDWASFDWSVPYGPPSGSATVGGGLLTVDRARANPEPIGVGDYSPGRSVEAVVTFTGQAFQHVGFGAGSHSEATPGSGAVFDVNPTAMFSTGQLGTQLQARYGSGPTEVNVGANCTNLTCFNETHRYRIDWTATTVEFFIDGVSVHADTIAIPGPMRPAISDFGGGTSFDTDWLRMTPYGSPCSYDSAVIDGNAGADWTTLVATSGLPPGTAVSLETHTGNVLVPDGSWSTFAAVVGGVIASPNAQYLQYRATLSTTDPDQTSELQAVAVSYDACTPSGPEVCGNAIDEDCDGQDGVCPPTPTPTATPNPPTPTPTATPLCGNGNVDIGAGELCDDGNTVNGDCCSSTCQFEPAGQSCNDHNTCTTGETCNATGLCRGFTACNTTLTCNICGSNCTLQASVCKCG